ncbi:MAG: hypothetical protein KZQ76_10955 [Candidatus Thiodiazotropha sp. (ex Epidulcina cf. delphinae)]|nr:hypothetical protein [Candidatus Thiodiazotropha sp. (ex Epidulcina cf. delphinae)]
MLAKCEVLPGNAERALGTIIMLPGETSGLRQMMLPSSSAANNSYLAYMAAIENPDAGLKDIDNSSFGVQIQLVSMFYVGTHDVNRA